MRRQRGHDVHVPFEPTRLIGCGCGGRYGVSPAGVSLPVVVLPVVLSLPTSSVSPGVGAGAGGLGGWQPVEIETNAAAVKPRIIRESFFMSVSPIRSI
jgi:hypothetical protein